MQPLNKADELELQAQQEAEAQAAIQLQAYNRGLVATALQRTRSHFIECRLPVPSDNLSYSHRHDALVVDDTLLSLDGVHIIMHIVDFYAGSALPQFLQGYVLSLQSLGATVTCTTETPHNGGVNQISNTCGFVAAFACTLLKYRRDEHDTDWAHVNCTHAVSREIVTTSHQWHGE